MAVKVLALIFRRGPEGLVNYAYRRNGVYIVAARYTVVVGRVQFAVVARVAHARTVIRAN